MNNKLRNKLEKMLFEIYEKGVENEDCNITKSLDKLLKAINYTRCCTELKMVKQGENLILDNKFNVEVVTPESSVLIKHKDKDRLIWVDKQRLKRK